MSYPSLSNAEWLREMYTEKLFSTTEIGKIVDRVDGTVRQALVKFQIPLRTRSEASKLGIQKYPRKGENTSNWRGGKIVDKSTGYVRIYNPDHPDARGDGYVFEHRLAMEKSLGRRLEKNEVIHHINGDKSDNRIENLLLHDSQKSHKVTHKDLVIENARLRKLLDENKIKY